MNSNIGVIIPVDTEKNLKKIELGLFSLLGQAVSPATAYLVCSENLKENSYLHEIIYFFTSQASFNIKLIYAQSNQKTYKLLNLGLENVAEKYIAFLIPGEVLYPNAYHLLVNKMKPDIGISFANIIKKRVEDCSGQFYAVNLVEEKSFRPEFWEDYYYNKAGYISFLINKELIFKENLYFSEEKSSQLMLTRFLSRIGENLQKNIKSLHVCLGEKWIFNDEEIALERNTLNTLWQEKMTEFEKSYFFESKIKKDKKSLYSKIIPFMKYLRYHFFK